MLASGRLEVSAVQDAHGGGRRVCMTAATGRLVNAPSHQLRETSANFVNQSDAAKVVSSSTVDLPHIATSATPSSISRFNYHELVGSVGTIGSIGSSKGSRTSGSTVAASIGPSAYSDSVDGLRTSPAALDASFQSVSATWHSEPILRVPAAFDAFAGESWIATSSSLARRKALSYNHVRETSGGAARSEHVLGRAFVVGMTAKLMRRAADRVAEQHHAQSSRHHSRDGIATQPDDVNVVSTMVTQYQAIPPLPIAAARFDVIKRSLPAKYGECADCTAALGEIARSVMCLYAGATSDAASGMHITVISAASPAPTAAVTTCDARGLLGGSRAAALEVGGDIRVTSERNNSCDYASPLLIGHDVLTWIPPSNEGPLLALPNYAGSCQDVSGRGISVPRAVELAAARQPKSDMHGGNDVLVESVRQSVGCDGACVGASVTAAIAALLEPDIVRRRPPRGLSPTLLAGKPVVIAGGTGALGASIAAHATDRWRCPVTLLSRSGRSANVGKILTGATNLTVLCCVAADVSTSSDRLAWNDDGDSSAQPPVEIVMHAGGVLRDASAQNTSAGCARAVVAAKCSAAAQLTRAFAGTPLHASASFSSIAAMLGSAGQIAYSAANASLDSLAEAQSFSGLPARSVQWGPWGGGGMAAEATTMVGRLARRGLGLLSPEDGIQAVERLLLGLNGVVDIRCDNGAPLCDVGSSSWSTVCVSRTDWSTYAEAVPDWSKTDAAHFLECVIPASVLALADGDMIAVDEKEPRGRDYTHLLS